MKKTPNFQKMPFLNKDKNRQNKQPLPQQTSLFYIIQYIQNGVILKESSETVSVIPTRFFIL